MYIFSILFLFFVIFKHSKEENVTSINLILRFTFPVSLFQLVSSFSYTFSLDYLLGFILLGGGKCYANLLTLCFALAAYFSGQKGGTLSSFGEASLVRPPPEYM